MRVLVVDAFGDLDCPAVEVSAQRLIEKTRQIRASDQKLPSLPARKRFFQDALRRAFQNIYRQGGQCASGEQFFGDLRPSPSRVFAGDFFRFGDYLADERFRVARTIKKRVASDARPNREARG